MKAVFVERPDSLSVREVVDPNGQAALGAYDCRCEMLFGTICAGTDRHILKDALPWRMPYPLVLGHESVGRVTECGAKVRYLRPGDVVARVGTRADPDGDWNIGWGGFAEWGFARDYRAMQEDSVPESEWQAYRIHQVIPPDIEPAIGPLFITWRETLSYIHRLGIRFGGRVLIIGSGGNGFAFASHARNVGAETILLIGNAAREAEGRAAGATDYADYAAPDLLATLKAAYPAGFDFLIDSVGKADSANAFLPLLASGGVIGIYGLDEASEIALKPALARGDFTVYQSGYDEAETHDAIIAAVRAGRLDPSVWLGRDLPSWKLDAIADAFDAIHRRDAIKPLIQLRE